MLSDFVIDSFFQNKISFSEVLLLFSKCIHMYIGMRAYRQSIMYIDRIFLVRIPYMVMMYPCMVCIYPSLCTSSHRYIAGANIFSMRFL